MPLSAPSEARAGPGVAAGARGAAQNEAAAVRSRKNLILD